MESGSFFECSADATVTPGVLVGFEAIAALFESARLSEDLDQTRREIAVTDQVARILTSTLDIEGAYDEFFAAVRELVDFDVVSVVTVNGDTQEVVAIYIATPMNFPFYIGQTFGLSGFVLGKVMETGSTVAIMDLTDTPEYRLSAH